MRHKTPEINLPKISYKSIIFVALLSSTIGAIVTNTTVKALLPKDQLSLVKDTTNGLLNTPPVKQTVNSVLPTTENSPNVTHSSINPLAATRQSVKSLSPPTPGQNATKPVLDEQSPKAASALPIPSFATLPLINDRVSSNQLEKPELSPIITTTDRAGGFSAALAGILQPSKYGWKLFGILWFWWVGALTFMVVTLRYMFQKFSLLSLKIIDR